MNTIWFKNKLADKKLSQRGLSRLLELDPAAVSLMLRGHRRMTNEEAHQIASIIGVPITEVLRQAGIEVVDDVRRVPIKGFVDEQGNVTLFPSKTHESVTGPADCPAGTYAIQVRAPGAIEDGHLLFISPAEHPASEHIDHLCTCALDTGQQVIASVRRGYRANTHNLLAYPSRAMRHDCRVVWAAPILWVKPQ